MKELLIAEMKRAIELLEDSEKPFDYDWEHPGKSAEIKRLMLSVRKHSVELEKQSKRMWDR